MSNILSKAIVAESTDSINGNAIMVCLQTDQTIRLKLKEGKSEVLSIGIKELYDYLFNKGVVPTIVKEEKTKKKGKDKKDSEYENIEIRDYDPDEPLINLNDWRSSFLISTLPYEIKVELESRVVGLLGIYKQRKKKRNEDN